MRRSAAKALEHAFAAIDPQGLALALGRYEQALFWCDESLALDPEAAKVWNTRCGALRALGRI